jgi:hypothetical protein
MYSCVCVILTPLLKVSGSVPVWHHIRNYESMELSKSIANLLNDQSEFPMSLSKTSPLIYQNILILIINCARNFYLWG